MYSICLRWSIGGTTNAEQLPLLRSPKSCHEKRSVTRSRGEKTAMP